MRDFFSFLRFMAGIVFGIFVFIGTTNFFLLNAAVNSGELQGKYDDITHGLQVLNGQDRDRLVSRAVDWNEDLRSHRYWEDTIIWGWTIPESITEFDFIVIE